MNHAFHPRLRTLASLLSSCAVISACGGGDAEISVAKGASSDAGPATTDTRQQSMAIAARTGNAPATTNDADPAASAGSPGSGYFVDSVGGSDSNAGSFQSPWKTLKKLTGVDVTSGQGIWLRCGSVWRESLTIGINAMVDRIAEGASVAGYGDCAAAKATISGADDFSGNWTRTGNVWSRRVPAGTAKITRLFVKGIAVRTAQWPNFGGIGHEYAIAATPASDSRSELQLNAADASALSGKDVAGAIVNVRSEPFSIELRTVRSVSGNTLQFTSPAYYDLEAGDGFVLQDKAWMLDAPGEFHHDTASNTVTVYPPDAATQANLNTALVEGSVRQNVLKVADRNSISVSDISAVMSSGHGVAVHGAPGIALNRVDASHNAASGVFISIGSVPSNIANGATVRNGTIDDNWMMGIDAGKVPKAEITGNTITDTGTLAYTGWSDAGLKSAPGAIVDANVIRRSAHMAISFSSVGGSRITNNVVSGYCLRLTDCSGIYTSGGRGLENQSSLLEGNQVFEATPSSEGAAGGANTKVVGIYFDDYSSGVTANNNLMLGMPTGMYVHNGSNHTITNNKFWLTSAVGLLAIMDRDDGDFMTGNVISGNRFVPAVAVSGRYPDLPFQGSSLAISFTNRMSGTDTLTSGSNRFSDNRIVPMFGASNVVATAGGMLLSTDGWRRLNADEGAVSTPATYTLYNATFGPELMPAGDFDNGISGWSAWLQSGGQGGHATSTSGVDGCSGPCASFSAGKSGDLLISSGFRMTTGAPHVIKYTAVLGGAGTLEAPSIIRNGSPYTYFGGPDGYASMSARTGKSGDVVGYEGMFKPSSGDEARLNLTVTAGVQVAFDSVSLKKVTGYSVPATSELAVAGYASPSASSTVSCASLGWPAGCTTIDSDGRAVSLPVVLAAGSSRLFMRTDTSWKR